MCPLTRLGTPPSVACSRIDAPFSPRSQLNFFSVFPFTRTSKFSILDRFYRVHEHTNNPKMKFMTRIEFNGHVVSKGFGPNKKSSKTAAA
jgi:hypothetical protein